jgi:hypothetical protein
MTEGAFGGDCARCGNYLPLNEAGLCQTCQGRPPCLNHPERGAVGRCRMCKETFCRVCMPQRHCQACQAQVDSERPKGPRGPKGATGPLPPTAPAKAPSRRPKPLHLLVGGVALLFLINGGLFLWRYLDTPASTPEARMTQRLAVVRSAIRNFKAQHQANPKGASEVQALLKRSGRGDLRVVGSEAEAGPGDVIFRPKGRGYEVYAKDEEGKIFRRASNRRARPAP